jgi:hypothetical protein
LLFFFEKNEKFLEWPEMARTLGYPPKNQPNHSVNMTGAKLLIIYLLLAKNMK